MSGAVHLTWGLADQPWDAATTDAARARVPDAILDHMPNYRRWQDVQMGLLGKLLLEQCLVEAGLEPDLVARMSWSDIGRPQLPVPGDFNITHSGGLAACAYDPTGRLGLDAERIQHVPLDELVDALSPREEEGIRRAEDRDTEFCRVWTYKEAVIKADGRGVGIGLSRIDSQDAEVELDGMRWFVRPLTLHPRFACHLATERPDRELCIHECSVSELLAR